MHPNAVYIIGTPQGQTTRLLYEKLLQYDNRIKLHHPSTGCVTEAHRNGVRTIVIAADPELPLRDMPAILKAARPLGICFLVVGDKTVWEKTVPLSMPEVAELDVVSPDSDWETPLLPPPPNITLTIESINGISVTRDIPAPDTMEPLVDLQEEMEDIISPTTTVVVENTEPEADGEDIRNSARLVITVIILLTIILGVLIYVIMACLAPSVPTQSTALPVQQQVETVSEAAATPPPARDSGTEDTSDNTASTPQATVNSEQATDGSTADNETKEPEENEPAASAETTSNSAS